MHRRRPITSPGTRLSCVLTNERDRLEVVLAVSACDRLGSSDVLQAVPRGSGLVSW